MARGATKQDEPDSASAAAGDRSPDMLVRDIEAARDRLAVTVDQIVERAHPKNAAKRTLDKVKSRFVNEDGSPRLETIGPVAGGALGVVGLVLVVRHVVGRE